MTVARMRSAAGSTGAGRPLSAVLRRSASASGFARSPNPRVSLPYTYSETPPENTSAS